MQPNLERRTCPEERPRDGGPLLLAEVRNWRGQQQVGVAGAAHSLFEGLIDGTAQRLHHVRFLGVTNLARQ